MSSPERRTSWWSVGRGDVPLTAQSWHERHRSLLVLAWALTAGVVAGAVAVGDGALLALGVPVAALTAAATLLQAMSMRLAATACAAALLGAGLAAVQLSGGRAEAHLVVVVAVAATTLYQSWTPLVVTWVVLVAYYGVLGTWTPGAVAAGDPTWRTPLAYLAATTMLAGIGLVAWQAEERVRRRYLDLATRNALIVSTIGEGVIALDAAGLVVQANPAAVALLGTDPTGAALADLIDDAPDDLSDPDDALGTGGVLGFGLDRAPDVGRGAGILTAALAEPDVPVVATARQTGLPLRIVATALAASTDGSAGLQTVLTLRDLRQQARADRAERRLRSVEEREAVQRESVSQLQAAMRPDPLELAEVGIGVTYLPALAAPAGGDSYDWLTLPDGTVHVSVVDVMGRGVAATKQALAVTSTLRTLALEGVPLADLVARTARVIGYEDPDLIATVIVAHYQPSDGWVRIAGGGHPPAMVLRGDGARPVSEIEAPGVPIGYPGAGSDGVADVVLAAGDTLLLYTDGLIEGTRDILAGLAALATTGAALATQEPQRLTDRLLAETPTAARHQDDCLALALRRRPVEQLPDGVRGLRLPPDTASVPAARRFLRRAAQDLGAQEDTVELLCLLGSELATNAVRHAGTPFQVRLESVAAGYHLSVADTEPLVGGQSLQRQVGGSAATSGRGLALIDACAATWGVQERPGGKVVWCVVRAAARQRAAV